MTLTSWDATDRVEHLVDLAVRGLPAMWQENADSFAQTLRGTPSSDGPVLRAEGISLRYTAIVALGAGRLPGDRQRAALAGRSAAELAVTAAAQAARHDDPGAVALAAWAAAEVAATPDPALVGRLRDLTTSGRPLPTVDASWMLVAALAAPELPGSDALITELRARLLSAQGSQGIFPHMLPASAQSRWRAHVGCFADQVYPIQALARLAAAHGDTAALAAADACARQICELQGPSGQWWWHYDVRDGSVVEPYPVYSVHQHAMAPMALRELIGAGGADYRAKVDLGLSWLWTHPETLEELISDRHALVWRKVARREPAKAARKVAAVTTSLRPGFHLPGLDQALPVGPIDHECRPYELGWLLYAWLEGRPSPHTAEAVGDRHA
ncbi:hypothetical protein [Georgenia thermotolerans]|uniref:N-acyl-D-glucosamine 2-epimerase n=1 Tax=Georgenia thermotolerans TaxID=527326 RepID=A0A7J5URC1_9MICO|nr:hypothetical protein [Georgenia thermotolerans]KAE8764877.1 hypothetical protein GB883_06630 [Georgenia thermotolerans]